MDAVRIANKQDMTKNNEGVRVAIAEACSAIGRSDIKAL